jgi:hypothetical protein
MVAALKPTFCFFNPIYACYGIGEEYAAARPTQQWDQNVKNSVE